MLISNNIKTDNTKNNIEQYKNLDYLMYVFIVSYSYICKSFFIYNNNKIITYFKILKELENFHKTDIYIKFIFLLSKKITKKYKYKKTLMQKTLICK